VVDRFACLRHDAVVSRDDENDDVGHTSAAGAHQRERFVAGRVEKHNPPAVDVGRIGADVLRDAARLALGDLGHPNRVEQRRLAVIDVAHDRDDRRALHQISRVDLTGLHLGELFLEAANQHLCAEAARDHRCRLAIERGVDGHHHPAIHQLLEDVLCLDLQLVRQVLDGHAFGQGDELGDGRRRFLRHRHVRTILAPRA
jgi:hypothetical protein